MLIVSYLSRNTPPTFITFCAGMAFHHQARTTVDSFMPVSLLVSNPSPWAVEVDVEVTCRAEGSEDTRAWSSEDSNEPARVMWCGMPR